MRNLRVEFVRNFLFAVGHAVNGGEHGLAIFRDERRSGKTIGGSGLIQISAKGFERFRFRHAGDGKSAGRGMARSSRPLIACGFRGINLNDDARKLVGIAFLQDCRTFREAAITGFLKIETAGLFAEAHFAVNIRGASGKVFLQKRQQRGLVAAVESGQPAGKLMGRRRVGELYLRGQTDGDQQNHSGQSKLSPDFHGAYYNPPSRFLLLKMNPCWTRSLPRFSQSSDACESIQRTLRRPRMLKEVND